MISRRAFLQGMLGTASGAIGMALWGGLGAQTATAQTIGGRGDVLGLVRLGLGRMTLSFINDSFTDIPANNFAVNATTRDLRPLLDAYHLPNQVRVGFNVLLVQEEDRTVLIDTGFGDVTSKLANTLEVIGVAATSITDVIITHFHGDHIGGAVVNGAAAFANAQYHFPQAEYDALQAAASPNDGQRAALRDLSVLEGSDQLALFGPQAEVVTGVTAIPAEGHTAGHTALMLSSNNRQLLCLADTAVQALISLYNPAWAFGFDQDGEVAAVSRRRLLDMAATDGLQIFSYHFPFPGVGTVSRRTDNDGYQFLPL